MISLLRKTIWLVFATAVFLIFVGVVSNVYAVSETGRTNYTLMKGVTESTVYVTDNLDRNVKIHILRINNGADIMFKATSAKYYKSKSTKASRKRNAKKWSKKKWGFDTVKNQIKKYRASKGISGKTVVAAVNGDFYNKKKNGATLGKLVIEGNVINNSKKEPFFAVMKNGTYAIKSPKSSTKNIAEAIGGGGYLIKNGAIKVRGTYNSYSCMAIGITDNKDVVIVNAGNNSPDNIGTTAFNVAVIMKQQGCVDAIFLDGGGSSSFLTKRKNNKIPVMRNQSIDGLARNVSTALLVVKKTNKKTVTGNATVSMKMAGTKLTRDAFGKYHYTANGKLYDGFTNINGKPYLFKKGSGLTKTVKIGNTKYYFKKGVLSKVSDKKAGRTVVGFCGASKNGKNLIFMYQYGDRTLNIGLNPFINKNSGRMKNWRDITAVPWTTDKYKIKKIVVGSGVKNIGDCFILIPISPFNDNAKNKKSTLKKVVMPASLKTIGKTAFLNHYRLKSITVPKNVIFIGSGAFSYNMGAKYTFMSKKPPKIAAKAFKRNPKCKKKSTLKVPKTAKWKKFLGKRNNLKRIRFIGKIKYTK